MHLQSHQVFSLTSGIGEHPGGGVERATAGNHHGRILSPGTEVVKQVG